MNSSSPPARRCPRPDLDRRSRLSRAACRPVPHQVSRCPPHTRRAARRTVASPPAAASVFRSAPLAAPPAAICAASRCTCQSSNRSGEAGAVTARVGFFASDSNRRRSHRPRACRRCWRPTARSPSPPLPVRRREPARHAPRAGAADHQDGDEPDGDEQRHK